MASPTCGLVLDRHVPKNAGTTVRSMLRGNAKRGSCEYVGYDLGRTWQSRVGFNHTSLAELVAQLSVEPPPRRRLCAEAHMVAGSFWTDLAALRATAFAQRACRVVVMVRVREPYSWYKSFYDWAVRPRQRTGEARWGQNFTDWLPYNMQSRYLLHGTRGQPSEWADDLASRALPNAPTRLGDERWQELTVALDRSVDVLAPLERLDDALALLLLRSGGVGGVGSGGVGGGLLSSLAYTTTRPHPVRGPWERRPQMNAGVQSAVDFCEADETAHARCVAAVRAHAADDYRLHALATARFDAQWRSEGAAAAQAAAAVAAAEAARSGGEAGATGARTTAVGGRGRPLGRRGGGGGRGRRMRGGRAKLE